MRTEYCGQLRQSHVGQQVTLCGWVNRRRDLGSLIFIDMRDREGIVQVFFDPDRADALKLASELRNEFCIQVTGTVRAREEKNINADMATGAIEVLASDLTIINRSESLPLDSNHVNTEEARLKYRYLDLRRPEMAQRLKTRAKITSLVRRFMDDHGFLDIETPMLTKATPEGARDYLVPSRVHKGKFYALPQSPQLFKQLLMMSGFDRYYQIVKCFRDEDLRADRQPEFTQIDVETSFMTAGQVSDYTGAAALLDSLPKAQWMLADRGYDADWFRDALQEKGITPCIPGRKIRNKTVKYDKRRYKRRNRIEIMFGRLKDWRRVATRYDRCPKVFLSAIALAALVIYWL